MALSRTWRGCLQRQLCIGGPFRFLATDHTAVTAPAPNVVAKSEEDEKAELIGSWGRYYVHPRPLTPLPKGFKQYPDHDTVNFPRHEQVKERKKTRLVVIPDCWFTALYNKTGVTGPYLFGIGVASFLLSKEIIVWTEESATLPPFIIVMYILYNVLGYDISKYAHTMWQERADAEIATRNSIINYAKNFKTSTEKQITGAENLINLLPEVYRENAALQLEAGYRSRIQQLFNETKRRLDFIAESENAKKRFEQRHMIEWIVSEVLKSITPDKEQMIMNQCISDLKMMATSA